VGGRTVKSIHPQGTTTKEGIIYIYLADQLQVESQDETASRRKSVHSGSRGGLSARRKFSSQTEPSPARSVKMGKGSQTKDLEGGDVNDKKRG